MALNWQMVWRAAASVLALRADTVVTENRLLSGRQVLLLKAVKQAIQLPINGLLSELILGLAMSRPLLPSSMVNRSKRHARLVNLLVVRAQRMSARLSIEPLALHPQVAPILCKWFEVEWPSYYGPGGPGSAQRDIEAYANQGSLPVGVIALRDGNVCGVAALKAQSIASHTYLTPWAAAGFVHPSLRGQGIGRLLLGALEEEARKLGFGRIYCGTSTAESLLLRCGWERIDSVLHEGRRLGIYCKAL